MTTLNTLPMHVPLLKLLRIPLLLLLLLQLLLLMLSDGTATDGPGPFEAAVERRCFQFPYGANRKSKYSPSLDVEMF